MAVLILGYALVVSPPEIRYVMPSLPRPHKNFKFANPLKPSLFMHKSTNVGDIQENPMQFF